MADKPNPIKDEKILELARRVQGDSLLPWNADKQSRLIWNLFRSIMPEFDSKEEKDRAAKAWLAFWNTGSLSFSSNTAKRLADSGVCERAQRYSAKPDTEGMD